MAYEKVVDLSTDTVVKLGGFNEKTQKPNPTSMEGYYLGSRTVPTSNGTSVIHVFQTPKGNEGVWGTADLNTKLGSIKLGTQTKVDYKGKKKLQAGKTKHMYDVYSDKSNTIEVPNLTAGSVAVAAESTYADQDDAGEPEEDDEDEDALQTAALAVAEKRAADLAKVQALLKKNKTA